MCKSALCYSFAVTQFAKRGHPLDFVSGGNRKELLQEKGPL